jgi:hypothetical protein
MHDVQTYMLKQTSQNALTAHKGRLPCRRVKKNRMGLRRVACKCKGGHVHGILADRPHKCAEWQNNIESYAWPNPHTYDSYDLRTPENHGVLAGMSQESANAKQGGNTCILFVVRAVNLGAAACFTWFGGRCTLPRDSRCFIG